MLLCLALAQGLLYASLTPPWQAPDEPGHFEYAWTLARLRRIPSPEDADADLEQEMIASLYEWRYGELIDRPLPEQMPSRIRDLPRYLFVVPARTIRTGRFSLAYLWTALFLVPFAGQDLVFQLYVARLSSVCIYLAIVWAAFDTLRELFPRRLDLAVLVAAFVALNPQHAFINSIVGDGPLAEFFVLLAFACWVRLYARAPSPLAVLGIVLGTVGGMWTKTTAVFMLGVDLILGAWYALKWTRWTAGRVALALLALVLVAAAIWVWIDSPLGVRVRSKIQAFVAPSEWAWYDVKGMTFGEALLSTYDSFWANFGWMSLPIDPRWYGAVWAVSGLAAVGWLAGRGDPRPGASALSALTLLVAVGVYTWSALLSKAGSYYQGQGRYLYPAIVPFGFLFISGLDRLLDFDRSPAAGWAWVGFLIVLNGVCLAGTILPAFYG